MIGHEEERCQNAQKQNIIKNLLGTNFEQTCRYISICNGMYLAPELQCLLKVKQYLS